MNAPEITAINNIVLAVDGSEDSWAAVDMLRELPLSLSATIHAVSVLIPREASQKAWTLKAVLEQTAERLHGTGVLVAQNLLTGYPAEELMRFCETNHPDLIVMGATGLRSTLGILLGGVAQQIVEYACCPVLIVRAPYTGLNRILLVVDGSQHSEQALEYLGHYPLPFDSELLIMNVLPPMIYHDTVGPVLTPGMGVAPPVTSSELEALAIKQAQAEEREGRLLLQRVQKKMQAYGLSASAELRRGDAATEIIATIERKAIDLVVAGSRGLSQMQGWLLGSVSRKLVHYADCSVMIVKQPE